MLKLMIVEDNARLRAALHAGLDQTGSLNQVGERIPMKPSR